MSIPLSLYIHIPWCIRKCPYCDFNSHTSHAALPEAAYVDALLADLDDELIAAGGRPLQSIFFGGGTPSLFSGDAIRRLLDGVSERMTLAENCEITLEANPGTAESGHFSAYRTAGVNRLSIGIQSFNPKHLAKLGRIHNHEEALHAIALARQADFERINVDLMHGLPDQTVEDAIHDLHTAMDSDVTHISWYQLTIEPNTVFYTTPPVLPEESILMDIADAGDALLRRYDYTHYEVSAWSKAGEQSRHNVNYWSFGDYIGIGAGAHGKLSLPDGRTVRRWKTRLPANYLDPDKPFLAGEAAIARHELPVEFFMNALRLKEGVPAHWFVERTGCSLDVVRPVLDALQARGLMQADTTRLATTPQGFRHLDTVLQAFM